MVESWQGRYMSAMAVIAYRLISLSYRIASTRGPDLSYRIASLAESDCSYRVLSYRGHECELSYRIVSRPESTPTYRIVLSEARAARARSLGRAKARLQARACYGFTVIYRPHVASYRMLSSPYGFHNYRIVSYRLSGRSKFIVPWAIANATYRKLSYRDLSCHYLIVSYPELPGHVLPVQLSELP